MSIVIRQRWVTPELLDTLPVTSTDAIRSRGDLRRVNSLMGNASVISRRLAETITSRIDIVADLGTGDGTFLLDVLSRWRTASPLRTLLVDRQPTVSEETRRRLERLGCAVEVIRTDVFECLKQAPRWTNSVVLANLFLHHFRRADLASLLQLISQHCQTFIACEPRRSRLTLTVSRCLGLIGCSAVTRHDAIASVRAGFSGTELSENWPADSQWKVWEGPVGLFSHCFLARRKSYSG